MSHQLNSFWDLTGPALRLPQSGPHVGWVLPDAEAKLAHGSSESLYSQSSSNSSSSSPSNDFIEDTLYSQSLFDDELISQVLFTSGSQKEAIDFDLNFLPSSPECIDFTQINDLESDLDVFMPQDINRKSATHENINVEQAVEDPDVAMNLLHQLNADYISNDLPHSIHDVGTQFILPIDSTLIQMPAASAGLKLVPIAPIDAIPFQTNSFFATPNNSQLQVSSTIVVAPSTSNPATTFTLRDLVSMPDFHQAVLPTSVPIIYSNVQLSAGSIQLENFVVPQGNTSRIIRPEKRQRKKEQNKNAALKYRQKKRQEQGDFLSECLETERKNCELKLRVNEITREINYLKGLLLEISVA